MHGTHKQDGLRVFSCGTKAEKEVRIGLSGERTLFIYPPHKRAHLYFCPDNFIVSPASTKMVKNVSSCSTLVSTGSR